MHHKKSVHPGMYTMALNSHCSGNVDSTVYSTYVGLVVFNTVNTRKFASLTQNLTKYINNLLLV